MKAHPAAVLVNATPVIAGPGVDVGVFILPSAFVTSGWLGARASPRHRPSASVAACAARHHNSRRPPTTSQGECKGVLTGVNADPTTFGPLPDERRLLLALHGGITRPLPARRAVPAWRLAWSSLQSPVFMRARHRFLAQAAIRPCSLRPPWAQN